MLKRFLAIHLISCLIILPFTGSALADPIKIYLQDEGAQASVATPAEPMSAGDRLFAPLDGGSPSCHQARQDSTLPMPLPGTQSDNSSKGGFWQGIFDVFGFIGKSIFGAVKWLFGGLKFILPFAPQIAGLVFMGMSMKAQSDTVSSSKKTDGARALDGIIRQREADDRAKVVQRWTPVYNAAASKFLGVMPPRWGVSYGDSNGTDFTRRHDDTSKPAPNALLGDVVHIFQNNDDALYAPNNPFRQGGLIPVGIQPTPALNPNR